MRRSRARAHLCSPNRIKHLRRPRVLSLSRFRGLWRQVDVIDRGPQSLVRPRSDVKAESMQRAEIVFITPSSSFESSPATNFSNSLNQLPASWQFGAGFKIAFLL